MKKVIEATSTAAQTLEGSSLESFWNEKSDECRLVMSDGKQVPESIITSVKCFLNIENIFVLFKGSFNSLNTIGCKELNPYDKTQRLWEKSDVYEFFIGVRPEINGKYFELMIAPDGRWLSARINNIENRINADYSWDSAVDSASFVDEQNKIWYAGLKLSLVSICESEEVPSSFRCNFYRATGKFHGDELLAWSPTGSGANCFHRPEKFGTLLLSSSY